MNDPAYGLDRKIQVTMSSTEGTLIAWAVLALVLVLLGTVIGGCS